MALTYPTATKNARLQAVNSLVGAAGVLVIGTSALAGAVGVLASVPMSNPAFNVAAAAMTTNNLPRTTVATGTGNAAKAEIRDNAGTVIASLTVGLAGSGADVIINAIAVSTGQDVQLTVGTINHG